MAKWIKIGEAAKQLGCSRETIKKMINDQRLEGKRFGKTTKSPYYVTQETVNNWK